MARTNIPLSNLIGEGTVALGTYTGILDPTATAADQANGMNVVLASGAIPSAPAAELLLLRVANTAASALACIVRAGAYPPAFESMKGDLSVTVTNATTRWIGPLEYARHAQADGSINVDFAAGFTGTVTAFLVPTE